MKRYQLILKGIRLFLILYFIGGLLSTLTPRHEVFPVFSWFLFPLTPNLESKFALRLHQVAGELLEPPRYYEKAEGIVNEPKSIRVYQMVQDLGVAEKRNDSEEIKRLRSILENNYLHTPCRYELLVVTYDPVKRWKTGLMHEETVSTYNVP